MPGETISADAMVNWASEKMKGQNIVFVAEPHSEGIVHNVLKRVIGASAGKSNKLLLEAPDLFNDSVTRLSDLKAFWDSKHMSYMAELPRLTMKAGWVFHCVDGDCRAEGDVICGGKSVNRYGRERQIYIAKNILKWGLRTKGSCLVPYGANHIKGGKNLPDFASLMSVSSYKKADRKYVMWGKEKKVAMAVSYADLKGSINV